MVETLEHPHLVPYDLLIPFDFFGVAFSVTSHLTPPCAVGGEIARGVEGDLEGERGGTVRVGGSGVARRRVAWVTVYCSGAAM